MRPQVSAASHRREWRDASRPHPCDADWTVRCTATAHPVDDRYSSQCPHRWVEHITPDGPADVFGEPHGLECVKLVRDIADRNWKVQPL